MAKILDIDTKYRIIAIIVLIFFLFIIIGTISASFISSKSTDEEIESIVLNDGNLAIDYVDGQKINIKDKKKHSYGVTITNTGTTKLYYSISLDDVSTSRNCLITIVDEQGNIVNKVNKITKNNNLINLYSIAGGETIRYKVEFTTKRKVKISGQINVSNESTTNDRFADLILLNNEIKNPKTRVGSELAIEDEGLIKITDGKLSIYYFRGNVKNNYVKLGNHMFRIVRINSNSTVRLVLDETLDNALPYNTNPIPEGNTVGSLGTLASSSLADVLNNWIDTVLNEYTQFISTENYCMDQTFAYAAYNNLYSNAFERTFIDNAPSLDCTTNYTSKIGLLSVDEVSLAGAYRNNSNKKYYLYNEKITEPYLLNNSMYTTEAGGLVMMAVNPDGSLSDGIPVNSNARIRPVINISTNALIKGNGTYENPYIIVS